LRAPRSNPAAEEVFSSSTIGLPSETEFNEKPLDLHQKQHYLCSIISGISNLHSHSNPDFSTGVNSVKEIQS
jgi:hypothetical protein